MKTVTSFRGGGCFFVDEGRWILPSGGAFRLFQAICLAWRKGQKREWKTDGTEP